MAFVGYTLFESEVINVEYVVGNRTITVIESPIVLDGRKYYAGYDNTGQKYMFYDDSDLKTKKAPQPTVEEPSKSLD